MEKRGDVSQTMLNDVIEKLESKLLNVEQNLHFMKNEVVREREKRERITSRDFKSPLQRRLQERSRSGLE
jgi:hypothetical protein